MGAAAGGDGAAGNQAALLLNAALLQKKDKNPHPAKRSSSDRMRIIRLSFRFHPHLDIIDGHRFSVRGDFQQQIGRDSAVVDNLKGIGRVIKVGGLHFGFADEGNGLAVGVGRDLLRASFGNAQLQRPVVCQLLGQVQ